jgi:hypothetical protein
VWVAEVNLTQHKEKKIWCRSPSHRYQNLVAKSAREKKIELQLFAELRARVVFFSFQQFSASPLP